MRTPTIPPLLPPGTGQPDFFSRQVLEARRFYLDLSPPADRPLAVVCGGREYCRADFAIHRPDFPYFALELVAQGRGSLRLAGEECHLVPGVVFSYGPKVPQDIAGDSAHPFVKYFVDFTGREALPLLQELSLRPGSMTRVADLAEIQAMFDDLIESGVKNGRHCARLCDLLLECLLLKIAEQSTPGGDETSAAFTTYRRCRRHIESHYARLVSLADAARQCHVDPAYLCRLFRRFDHQSPHQLLLRLKMNHAAGRLLEPGVSVKRVAAEMHFDDPAHFSRAFKAVFGVSPKDFRRLL